ncbi:DUF3127 domain-containing protein [Aureibacter tunicatorum]|uniref:Single-stranded DNA-binding protein n=1 Tax=Aureibacter tunicatorum TaxID=866807 RepID=A0AAE3XK32_9BACT|nr:DUF3127 domain-containing protein [Aureibacter tunicatorum]MDR6239241.1 single-stranded DNA-binding protein [Aureibacter tunicatorum]BDD04834.1 hypothetical protein AUTU_23170 [Aureibacter tunicatorum]
MNIQGKLNVIFDTQQVSDRFKKREFVIEYMDNPQYPQHIKFEIIQDSCAVLDNFKVGDEVMVEFNLRGRAWTNPQGQTNYFNSLQAWRVTAVAAQQPDNMGGGSEPFQNVPPPSEPPTINITEDNDDDSLPF